MKYPGIRHNAVSNTYFIIALPIVTGLVAVWLKEVAPEMRGLGLAVPALLIAMCIVAIPYAIVDIWGRLSYALRRDVGDK
jgi:hypothetical protein